jgi:hypothetical protein
VRRLALALAIVLAPASARAVSDYNLGSSEWNGLGQLGEEARAQGCPIVPSTTLDWSAIGPKDALWFIYPRAGIDTGQLGRYLNEGGRAVIADDYGAAGPALEALGIRRGRRPLEGVERYRDNFNLPIARRMMATDLGRSTDELVANHTARLETSLPPTFAFAPGAALVVEGQVGKGRFVALGDPSVLINNMLGIDGNLAFARTLIAQTCRPGERILLFTQTFASRGMAGGGAGGGAGGSLVEDLSDFTQFNKMLGQINQSLLKGVGDGSVFPLVALGIALAGLFVLFGIFPARGRIDFHWQQLRRLLDLGGARAKQHLPGDFGAAVVSLRREAVARLEELLGEPIDPARVVPAELGRRVAARTEEKAGRGTVELWRQLGRIRFATTDGVTVAADPISRRRLRRLHATCVALFPLLIEQPTIEA